MSAKFTKRLPFIEGLLHVRHSDVYTYLGLLTAVRSQLPPLGTVQSWGNPGSERQADSSKMTQLINRRPTLVSRALLVLTKPMRPYCHQHMPEAIREDVRTCLPFTFILKWKQYSGRHVSKMVEPYREQNKNIVFFLRKISLGKRVS